MGVRKTSVVYAIAVLEEGTPEEKAMAAAKIANLPQGRPSDNNHVDRRDYENAAENSENNVAGNTELEEMTAAKIANLPHGGDRKTDQDVGRRLDKNSPKNCENNSEECTKLEEMSVRQAAARAGIANGNGHENEKDIAAWDGGQIYNLQSRDRRLRTAQKTAKTSSKNTSN